MVQQGVWTTERGEKVLQINRILKDLRTPVDILLVIYDICSMHDTVFNWFG